MREGHIFSLSTLAGGGGGYPVPGLGRGGSPSQVWVGEYPISSRGVPHPRYGWWGGVPGEPPDQVWMVGRGIQGTHLTRSGWWGGGGYRPTRSGWWRVPGVPPNQVWMVRVGVPPNQVWMGGGYPPPIRQSSIASTCYVAGGLPLAFTQEDCLVSCALNKLDTET